MSYLDQAGGSQFKSYLGEDAVYEMSARPPSLSLIQKAQAMSRVAAAIERKRKLMTPRQRAVQYDQLLAFLKTIPLAKRNLVVNAAKRNANSSSALGGYSGQHDLGLGSAHWAASLLGAANLYLGYQGIKDQKDARRAADKRAAAQAKADLDYQKAQIRMAEQAQKAAQQQKLALAQAAANKPKMSTGTKVAIGAGVAVAATAAVVAMN